MFRAPCGDFYLPVDNIHHLDVGDGMSASNTKLHYIISSQSLTWKNRLDIYLRIYFIA